MQDLEVHLISSLSQLFGGHNAWRIFIIGEPLKDNNKENHRTDVELSGLDHQPRTRVTVWLRTSHLTSSDPEFLIAQTQWPLGQEGQKGKGNKNNIFLRILSSNPHRGTFGSMPQATQLVGGKARIQSWVCQALILSSFHDTVQCFFTSASEDP